MRQNAYPTPVWAEKKMELEEKKEVYLMEK